MQTTKNINKTLAALTLWTTALLWVLAFNPLGYSFWQNTAILLSYGIVTLSFIASIWVGDCSNL